MKKPKVIVYNGVSLDGSIKDFEVNMELYYQIAGNYNADIKLVGSVTAKTGIEMFCKEIPKEEEKDFKKPEKDKNLPYWVFVDTKGILKGTLHISRNFEFCRDVVVLVSEKTPKDYIEYLEKRDYDYIVAGEDHVDLKKALEILSEKYDAKTVVTDTGGTLSCLLLEQGLVDEISLLIHPTILGDKSTNIFRTLKKNIKLELIKSEVFDKDYLLVVYKVLK